jgi:hypothetical protein
MTEYLEGPNAIRQRGHANNTLIFILYSIALLLIVYKHVQFELMVDYKYRMCISLKIDILSAHREMNISGLGGTLLSWRVTKCYDLV